MNKKWKWIGIGVVVVIVILLILPYLIPVNRFRPTIEQTASEALGRKVQLGDLSLSILGGSVGIDNVSIGDDPKFNSGPFLTAKKVRVGVELLPLVFSKQLKVTEIRVVQPQVMLLKDPSGKWNFSSIGGSSAPAPTPAPAQKTPQAGGGGSSAEGVSIHKLSLQDGQITLGNTNSQKRSVYSQVNLKATDVATTNNFPLQFSMALPGGGTMKIDGKVGPVDPKDAALTPQNVKLTVSGLDLAKTGFLDPGLGLAGMVDIDATLVSQGGKMNTKGQLKLTKTVLVAGGKPSGVPAVINFDTTYDPVASSGVLNPSTINIGNAKTNLSGTYKSVGDEFAVDMKIEGQGLPATDLETFLPALAINPPEGSRLSAGILNTNLHLSGPTDKLVTDGTIGLYNGKLTGFDLGQKMSGVASLAGIKTGKDLDIEKFTSNVHMAPTGLRADNIDLEIPTLGSVVGAGTLDAKNNMNFNLVATVKSSLVSGSEGAIGGTIGKLTGGGSSCKNGGMKVPLQIHGTTSNPQFTPDVGGATASLMKSELACAGGGQVGNAAGGAVSKLGGLFGGKSKKP